MFDITKPATVGAVSAGGVVTAVDLTRTAAVSGPVWELRVTAIEEGGCALFEVLRVDQ